MTAPDETEPSPAPPPTAPPRDPDADVPASEDMADDLRRRREQTWEMLVVKGFDYGEVCETLAAEYDVTRSAIEQDIARMDDWLPKLTQLSTKSGTSRLRELRKNRQRRHQMALAAREDGNLDRERRLLNDIDNSLKLDIKLAQSLGRTQREPQEHVTKHEGTVNHELTDQQQAHLQQLKEQSRDAITERDVDIIDVEDVEAADDADA